MKSFLCLLPMILLGGLIALTHGSVNASPGETGLAALTLLHEGFMGNPYLIPTGPTAHAAPGTVALLAIIYEMFGGNTVGARVALSLIALLQYLAASLLVIARVTAAFAGRTRVIALCLVAAVLPLFLAQAVVSYRQWDQPTSALLLALIARAWFDDRPGRMRWTNRAATLGLLGGIGSLFAPVLPVAALVAAIHVAWCKSNWRLLAATALIIAVLMAPWLVRNELALGAPLLTRSNFGLELALGNNDVSDGNYDLHTAPPLHPHDNRDAALHLATIGEAAYMREMSAIADRWIAGHPGRFAELCGRRALLLLFPPASLHDTVYRQFWAPVAWLVNLAGLASLALLAVRRETVLPWLTCVYLPLLPGIVTHADIRYAFPSFFVGLGLIVSGAACLLRRIRPLARHALSEAT